MARKMVRLSDEQRDIINRGLAKGYADDLICEALADAAQPAGANTDWQALLDHVRWEKARKTRSLFAFAWHG